MNQSEAKAYIKSLDIVDFSDILIGDPLTTPLDKFLPIVNNREAAVELIFDRNMLSYLSGLCNGNNVNGDNRGESPQRKLATMLYILNDYGLCRIGDNSRLALRELIMSNQDENLSDKKKLIALRRFQRETEAIYNISNNLKPHALKNIARGDVDKIEKNEVFSQWVGFADIPREYINFPDEFSHTLYTHWCNVSLLICNINRNDNINGVKKLRTFLASARSSAMNPSLDAIWATRVFCGTTNGCKKHFGKNESRHAIKKTCLNQAWDFYLMSAYIKLLADKAIHSPNPNRYIYLVTSDIDLRETLSSTLVFGSDNWEDILTPKIQTWCGKRANEVITILKEHAALIKLRGV